MKTLFRLALALTAVLVMGLADRAEAQTLTFDELPAPDATIMSSVVCGNVSGFRFTSAHFHTLGPTITTDFTNNGTTHIGYESIRGFPIVMDRVNGGTFSLQSLDAGEFYFPARADHPDAEFVQITGTLAGGGTVTHQLTLDGIRDGLGGVDDYQHFTLPNTFTNLTQVTFTGFITGGADGGIALDNLQYSLGSAGTVGTCVSTPATTTNGPSVTLDSPVPGNVLGTIQLSATASAPAGLANVQFRVDGNAVGAPLTSAPFSVAFNTTTVPDGQHTITAVASDINNLTATASVVVTVRNTPITGTDPHFLEFDGVDDYLAVGDANQLSFGNGTADSPFTFEMWFRPDQMVRHQLIGKWGETTNQEYRFQVASGTFRLDLRDNSAGATASVFTSAAYTQLVGSWHHVAVTYDGRGGATAADGVTIYLDGVAQAVLRQNNAAYVAMEDLTDPVQIAREGPSWRMLDGGLDEIRVWNVARTVGQIQGFMNSEMAGTEAGLVGYWRLNEGAGLLAGDATVNAQTATLVNGPAWSTGGPVLNVPDTTPPTITGIVTSAITASTATVSFSTNETTTATVSYSATGSCPCTVVNSLTTGTAHAVTLTGLAPTTQYTFFVGATDTSGNLATSANAVFTTATVDPIPPTVTITAPAAGTVAGVVTLSATASDNVGVVSVTFKVDGTTIGAPDTVAPYSVSWNSATISDGAHTITVEARDAANNLATATRAVTVQNAAAAPLPLSVAFGAGVGLWRYTNAGGWLQLHGLSPTVLAQADVDGNGAVDTVAVFAGYGVWVFLNGSIWSQIHPFDASDIKSGDVDGNGRADLILNFPGLGLWARFDSGTWTRLHGLNPTRVVVADIDGGAPARADVIVNFPGFGVWAFMNNGAWVQLHGFTAVDLKAGDLDGNGQADLIVQFSGFGEWVFANNSNWTQLHGAAASGIVVGNVDNDAGHRADVIINFPGAGVWVFRNNSTWVQLHPLNAPVMAVTDLDGNGRDDVALGFPGFGLYVWANGSTWNQLHLAMPQVMAGGR